jgi:hypothetical protein
MVMLLYPKAQAGARQTLAILPGRDIERRGGAAQ